VPLTKDEGSEKMPTYLKNLAQDYDTRYVNEWTDWFQDIQVSSPTSVKDAIEKYGTLTRPDWPYLRILRALEDHTQWKHDKSALENDAGVALVNQKLSQKASQKTGLRINVDVRQLGEHVSIVPNTFKKTVEFGIPDAHANAPITDTPLAKYIDSLSSLRTDMIRMNDQQANVDMRVLQEKLLDASKAADSLLEPFDDKAKTLLAPLLQTPLHIAGTKLAIPGTGRYPAPPPNRWIKR
jgi:type VI secretion system protein ImpL